METENNQRTHTDINSTKMDTAKSRPKLSVFIVTLNESRNIQACLESVSFADEIVVVDSNSTDNTVDIAKQFTDKVFISPWEGCGPQKLKALNLTTGEWVLCLDADERVTEKLRNEILENINIRAPSNSNGFDISGFEIPFTSFYCGKKIRFGDWLNESHLRLFRRDKGTVIPRLVHFRIEVQGKIKRLKHTILHYSYPNLTSVIHKMNVYSTDGAKHKYQQGKRSGILNAVLHGLWTFIRGYFIKLGFLDGREGFLLAVSNAEGCYYRYAKLMYCPEE